MEELKQRHDSSKPMILLSMWSSRQQRFSLPGTWHLERQLRGSSSICRYTAPWIQRYFELSGVWVVSEALQVGMYYTSQVDMSRDICQMSNIRLGREKKSTKNLTKKMWAWHKNKVHCPTQWHTAVIILALWKRILKGWDQPELQEKQ